MYLVVLSGIQPSSCVGQVHGFDPALRQVVPDDLTRLPRLVGLVEERPAVDYVPVALEDRHLY